MTKATDIRTKKNLATPMAVRGGLSWAESNEYRRKGGRPEVQKTGGRPGVQETGGLLEVLQVEVHQARVIVLVCVGEEAEVALCLIEARGRGQRVDGQETAARAVVVPEHHADCSQDEFAEAHAGIAGVNGQTANLQGGVVPAPLAVGNLAVDAVGRRLLRVFQPDGIVQQTEIGYQVAVLLVHHKIGLGQQLRLVVLGLVRQKIVQVALGALERFQIALRSQFLIRILRPHLNSEQLGELRFASSYASRAFLLNSSDTGVGCSMCQRNRSASLPVSTGVSLIGLAIVVTVLWVSGAKIRINIELHDKLHGNYMMKKK